MPKNSLTLLQERSLHSALVKVRCTPDLKIRLLRKAVASESDISTVARDAFRFYLAQEAQERLVAR